MDFLLSGVSLVTVLGLFYKAFNLYLARKTDTIFFTKSKEKIRNAIIYLSMIIVMSVSIYFVPLLLNYDGFPNAVIKSVADVIVTITALIISFMSILYQSKLGGNKVRKLLTLYFNCNVVWLIIFSVFWGYGLVLIYKISEVSNNIYTNGYKVLGVSVFWSLLSLTIFSVYIDDYRKVKRRTCWFEYSETDLSKPVKYYIYYAPDNEYVVCGRLDKYVIHFKKRMDIYQR